MHDPILVKIFT